MDFRSIILGVALGWTLIAGLAQAQIQTPATPYDGLKKTVSVDQFQAAESTGGAVTADGMTTLLTNALVKDGRFIVVERPALSGPR